MPKRIQRKRTKGWRMPTLQVDNILNVWYNPLYAI